MAIRMYHDSGGTSEVTSGNPDTVSEAIQINDDLINIETFFLLTDDTGLAYENVSIAKQGTSSSQTIYVDYALNLADFDSISVGSQQSLNLSDGDYSSAIAIHRRVTVQSLTTPFNTSAEIYHRVQRDEYAK